MGSKPLIALAGVIAVSIVVYFVSARFRSNSSSFVPPVFIRYDSFESVQASYEITMLGKQDKGQTFIFPDFDLTRVYYRGLTAEEKSRKDAAIAEGMDGGEAMLQPYNGFEVRAKDGELIQKFELSILPYDSQAISANEKKFKITNDDKGWIVNVVQN